jgi:NAD kinase
VVDGRDPIPLALGQVLKIERHTERARFVSNPTTTFWKVLVEKLHWAAPPQYRVENAPLP